MPVQFIQAPQPGLERVMPVHNETLTRPGFGEELMSSLARGVGGGISQAIGDSVGSLFKPDPNQITAFQARELGQKDQEIANQKAYQDAELKSRDRGSAEHNMWKQDENGNWYNETGKDMPTKPVDPKDEILKQGFKNLLDSKNVGKKDTPTSSVDTTPQMHQGFLGPDPNIKTGAAPLVSGQSNVDPVKLQQFLNSIKQPGESINLPPGFNPTPYAP